MITIADFSENYRCVNQDEIQSAYYSYQQATLFPLIAYYTCLDCNDAVVQESVVFISPGLVHDAMAVAQYLKKMTEHVQGHVKFVHKVQFTDGCSSQFKSKLPFQHLSETKHITLKDHTLVLNMEKSLVMPWEGSLEDKLKCI